MELHHEKIPNKFGIICLEHDTTDEIIKNTYNHWHSKMEICCMIEGVCEFIINEKAYMAHKGDIIVIKSGEIHRFKLRYGCKIYVCTFEPMFLYNLKVDISNLHHHITVNQLKECGEENNISKCFETLYKEGKFEQKWSELIFKANLLNIYGILLSHFEINEENYIKDIAKLISFQKILEYIASNYTDDLNLKIVAQKFNYNYVYLSSMFRSRVGVNFKYYLDNIRISKALELLLTTDMTVAQVSTAIGYENIRTFNNVFKRITGFVPSKTKKDKS